MVLIIDDDLSVRILTERLVKTFGLLPLTAATGAEGIEMFQANASQIDVVVLDLTMPELNGEETFHKLRKLDPDVPIIFTSGYEKGAEVMHDSQTDFLQKPFKRLELREKLDKFLNGKSHAA